MEQFYRLIFRRAFKITWKHKWLWGFGLLALFVFSGNVYQFLLRAFLNLADGRSFFYIFREYWGGSFFRWGGLFTLTTGQNLHAGSIWTLVIWKSFLILILLAILILALICLAGLIKAAITLDQGRKVNYNKAFKVGQKFFLSVFGFNILVKVLLAAVILGIAWLVNLLILDSTWERLVLYVVFFVIFLVLTIILHFLTIYGTAYIILRKQKIFQAFCSAWRLFYKNVVINLEMGLLLFFFNIIVSFGALVFAIALVSPLILLYILTILLHTPLFAIIILSLMLIIFLITVLLVSGWFASFQISSWTILFEELEAARGMAKISRLTRHLVQRIKNIKIH